LTLLISGCLCPHLPVGGGFYVSPEKTSISRTGHLGERDPGRASQMTLPIIDSVKELGAGWQMAGSLPDPVLEKFWSLGKTAELNYTLETGCGRSTLLLSHVSKSHQVFVMCLDDADVDDSYRLVRSSPLLNEQAVEFILGPTQKTIPVHQFDRQYDLILLDGPHAYPFVELEYYFIYPHIRPGGYLIIDDLWIPTIHNMFGVLKEDAMFRLDEVVENTGFLIRTDAPTFNPWGDGWENQPYNKTRFPVQHQPVSARRRLGRLLPKPVRDAIKRFTANHQ
jgi:hypothetical protein